MAGTIGNHAPFMAQVSVGTTATNQDLNTLLAAVYSAIAVGQKVCYLQIQLDTSAAGATLWIGNSNVSSTMYGAALSAGQINQQLAFDSNLVLLSDVFLLSSSGTIKANIIALTR